MTISTLADAGGVGVETIRFYQRRGLLDTPSRGAGIRRYGDADLRRLRFIRSAQAAGFTLDGIAELLALDATRDRSRVRALATERIAALDARIAELQQGDRIYVQTADGWYTYAFRSIEYVRPNGIGVLDAVPQTTGFEASDRIITLTSCHPMFSAAERFIAYGVLESWQPNSAGMPSELASQRAEED